MTKVCFHFEGEKLEIIEVDDSVTDCEKAIREAKEKEKNRRLHTHHFQMLPHVYHKI